MEEQTPTPNVPPSSLPGSEPPNSKLAIISLVSGILGWTVIPLLGSIAAVITGHMAKREIRNSGGALGGDGLATAGLILGYASLALIALTLCIIVCVFIFLVATQQNYGLLLTWWA